MCREIENSGITTENEHKSNKVSLLTFGDFSHHGSTTTTTTTTTMYLFQEI